MQMYIYTYIHIQIYTYINIHVCIFNHITESSTRGSEDMFQYASLFLNKKRNPPQKTAKHIMTIGCQTFFHVLDL